MSGEYSIVVPMNEEIDALYDYGEAESIEHYERFGTLTTQQHNKLKARMIEESRYE